MSEPEPLLAGEVVEALAARFDFSYRGVHYETPEEGTSTFVIESGELAGRTYRLTLKEVGQARTASDVAGKPTSVQALYQQLGGILANGGGDERVLLTALRAKPHPKITDIDATTGAPVFTLDDGRRYRAYTHVYDLKREVTFCLLDGTGRAVSRQTIRNASVGSTLEDLLIEMLEAE